MISTRTIAHGLEGPIICEYNRIGTFVRSISSLHGVLVEDGIFFYCSG